MAQPEVQEVQALELLAFLLAFFADATFKMKGSKWLNQAMFDIGEKDGEGISND